MIGFAQQEGKTKGWVYLVVLVAGEGERKRRRRELDRPSCRRNLSALGKSSDAFLFSRRRATERVGEKL